MKGHRTNLRTSLRLSCRHALESLESSSGIWGIPAASVTRFADVPKIFPHFTQKYSGSVGDETHIFWTIQKVFSGFILDEGEFC